MGLAAGFGTLRLYPPLTQLFGQDETVDEVFLLHNGLVKLVWNDASGNETIIGLRWPGQFLAAPACIANAPHPATAITLMDANLERMPSEKFLRLLETDVAFAMRVQESQSREILELSNSLGALACTPARARVEMFLAQVARELPGQRCLPDGRIRLPLKHKDIAALLAMRPESLSRTLQQMATAGIITRKGDWIVLHHDNSANGKG